MQISDLPTLNATLNGLSAVWLTCGYIFIRQKKITAHKTCMIGALITSALFLSSYLIYHYHAGSRPFTGQGTIRLVYFAILISHIILAITLVPLAISTLRKGLRGDYARHVRVARRTFPMWMYVSVTGIIVYLMLYQLY